MNSEARFLDAIRAEPANVELRLIYADWLEERGDPRAAYLRLLQSPQQDENRIAEFQRQFDPQWIAFITPVATILDNILDQLERLHRPVVKLLQPGMKEKEIRSLFSSVSLSPPQALIDLYVWRNGIHADSQATMSDINFVPGYYFMSLQEAVGRYQILITPYPDVVWDPLYFPFLIDGSDGNYAIHCEDGVASGDITWSLCGDTISVYESLPAMLLTARDCYESGAFHTCDEGRLGKDPRAHAMIAQKYNPSVAYWRRSIE